mmetsp:Transcript_30272/g.29592  ORF Transcript_30272/g.29592 Transcript_30272/m.29592 type:complete len:91 (-) Transcript_30272:128-400(-)
MIFCLLFNFILAGAQYGVTYLFSLFYYFSLIATLCKYELYLGGAIIAIYGLFLLGKKSAFISKLCKRKEVIAIKEIVEGKRKVVNPNNRD